MNLQRLLFALVFTAGLLAAQPFPDFPPAIPSTKAGNQLPSLCRPEYGETFFLTTTPVGLYYCKTRDTWERMAVSPDRDAVNADNITSGTLGAARLPAAVPSAYPGTGVPNSTGSAWGTSYSVSQSATASALAQRNSSGEVIAANTVATGKTPMATDTAATLSQLPAAAKVRLCEIVIGDPGSASAALANDNDRPGVCANLTGSAMTVTEVKCLADTDTGSPAVLPIITGGAADSILTGAVACGSGVFGSAGTLNGTVTQADGARVDANISTAGGTAKYVVISIKRTL